ncbi:MAG TPA: HAD-IA family hydrolase [Candidatus Saccharimonadales bacterium]|nr:HAD-IA family hydrolase [Candidatus Saccharimonadales bacterium]
MKQKPIVIFDFDGTIADTFVMAINIFYKLKPRWPILPKGEVERLRGMAFMQVARELQIPPWDIPFLLVRGRKIMAAHLDEAVIIPGMGEAIRQLHDSGYDLYVISSNSTENVSRFLERHQLLDQFTEIYGSIGLMGKAKAIKKLLKDKQVAPENAYYVGDEARDIEAAHKVKVHSIAVSWGYNNIKILADHKPKVLVFDPADIVKVVS